MTTPYTPAYDIYIGEGEGDWQEASRYHIWTKKYPLTAPALSLLERRDEGVVRVPERSRVMHRVPGQTPYHIEHLFGFWHTTANDTVFLRTEIDDSVIYTLIVATTKLGLETMTWYCPKCGERLHADEFQGRRFGLRAFWRHTTDAARAFNASPARTCAKCGHVHPVSYGFDDRLDNDEEREGRTLW